MTLKKTSLCRDAIYYQSKPQKAFTKHYQEATTDPLPKTRTETSTKWVFSILNRRNLKAPKQQKENKIKSETHQEAIICELTENPPLYLIYFLSPQVPKMIER